jgi:hypothetical protein
VPFVGSVLPESLTNELLITVTMPRPSGECLIEIDIDYQATGSNSNASALLDSINDALVLIFAPRI